MKETLRWIATPFAALLVVCLACCSRYGDGKSFYATPHTNSQGTIQYNVIHSTAECASSSEDGKKGGYRIVHDCYGRDYFCPKCMNDSLIYIIKHPEVPDSDSVVDDEEYEEYSYMDEETDRINTNRRRLYNDLTKRGDDLGSYEQFDKAMLDGNNRKWVYERAKKHGLNVGDYNTYENAIYNRQQ